MQMFRSVLEDKFLGKKLKTLDISSTKKFNAPLDDMKAAVEGTTLKEIVREGKELHFHFGNGRVLGMHLMLGGRFVLGKESAFPVPKSLFSLLFDDGTAFGVADRLGWAKIALDPEVPAVPDAASEEFTLAYLKEMAAKGKKTKAKSFLIDQNMVRGIGNAYSDEILWHSRIEPTSLMSKIPDDKMAELYKTIRHVLKGAEEKIMTQYYGDLAKEQRSFLKVHNPELKQTEDGEPILIGEVDKRKTYYTASQKLYI